MKNLTKLSCQIKQLLLAVIIVYVNTNAQDQQRKPFEQYFLRNWQSEQGLPHNSGRSIIQTYDGYLWIGSQDGLVRYNGKEFHIFNKYNTPALKHNDITALLQTADSNLWIGTFDGLTRYKRGVFTYHPTNAGFEKEVIRTLAADHAGNVWIGTMNAGLHKFRNGRFEFFTTKQGLSSNSINGIAEDYDGNLWVSSSKGINILHNGKWLFRQYDNNISNNLGRDIFVARDSTIWIGTNNGLLRWMNNSFHNYTTVDGLSDNVIRDIYQDRAGTIWIGTERGGICRFTDGVFSSFRASDGLTSDFVDAILEDHEGNYWVGTNTEGINKFWKGKFLNYSVRDGLPPYMIRTVMQTRNGNVWIGTEGGGVAVFDGRRFKLITTKNGLPNDFIKTFYEDAEGNIWIGTRDGLVKYRDRVLRIYKEKDGLSQNFIHSITGDRQGNLWVGTMSGGVHRLVNGRFVNYRDKGIPINIIKFLYVDQDNTLWITGTESVFRWQDGDVSMLTWRDGLPFEPIYSILEDSEHTLWMGSYGGGLVRFKNGKTTRYTYLNGLGDDVVYTILEDCFNNLWMSCNGGIFKVSKQMLNDYADGKIQSIQSTFYNALDGMVTNEISGDSQPAGWKDSDGCLWFPALKGLIVVDPRNLHENTIPPNVVIERTILNSIDKNMPQNNQIFLPGAGQAIFYYSALTYLSQERVKYRVKLEGIDKDWIEMDSRNEAHYANLSPGKYVFHVTACNNDNVWNEKGTSLAFELGRYYYQTIWFYGILVIAIFTTAFGVYHLRIWQLLKREQELKKRVDESMAQIKVLSGLIPICANCKKIRDDRGFWSQLETYIRNHSEASFTHGICPECTKELYGDLLKND